MAAIVDGGLAFVFIFVLPYRVAFAGSVFVMVGALDASGRNTLFHLALLGGLVPIAGVKIATSVGSSARETFTLIEVRFISADSALELDLAIAASGGPSAGPVPGACFSPQGRFVETSGDVIRRVLVNGSQAVNINLQRFTDFLDASMPSLCRL